MRLAVASVLLLALAACSDPLKDIDRVSAGAVLPSEPGSAALPSEEELAREGSILSGLFNGRNAGAYQASDSESTNRNAAIEAAVAEAHESDTPADAREALVGHSTVLDGPADVDAPTAETPRVTEAAVSTARQRVGVLGWLRRSAQTEASANTQAVIVPVAAVAADKDAVSDGTPTTEPSLDMVEPQKRRGLFGGARSTSSSDVDTADVMPGTLLPFGQVARACNTERSNLGKVVDRAARKGRGYALYDTVPDSTEPRTFFVTGFSDNCPRQFTASLALFGDPAFHEQLRYGLPADEYPYSSTDKAYEKLKRQVCNVGRNTPCGDRIERLSRNTTFISAYENFTDNARWADMLLHDGAVLATALKTP